MSIESVQTWLSQSGAVLLATAHRAPNVPGAGSAASGIDGGVLPEQAQSTNEQTRSNRCIA